MMKTSTSIFIALNVLKGAFGEVCNYFPGFPDVSYSVTINCGNECCGGRAMSIASACCDVYDKGDNTNYWWIIFPVVIGFLVLAILGLILALLCRYRKNKKRRDVTLMFPVTQTYCVPSSHQCEQALFDQEVNNQPYCQQTTTQHTKVHSQSQITYA